MQISAEQNANIGFFMSTSVEEFVFIGGAMVTDAYGLPVEFRYTEPVRANRLQRVLYGDVLERFIHTDVILTNLFDRMEQKPAYYIISDPSFISAANAKGAGTAIWIGETRVPSLASPGETQETGSNEFLVQITESGSPIRVKTGENCAGMESRLAVAALLTDLSRTMDITEPLRRIESAIALIWQESGENPLMPEPVLVG